MRLFVGNLPFPTTEDDLLQLFATHGVVDRVQIATDTVTGRPRSFGFIEMPQDAEAQAAITALHGTSLDGRPLTVNEAKPRPAGAKVRPRGW